MKNKLLAILVCAVFTCIVVPGSFARTSKKATPASTKEPTISAVSGNSITVVENKTARTVTVSPLSEIKLNGQKATFADLKPGMTVSLTLSSPTQASRIVATSK